MHTLKSIGKRLGNPLNWRPGDKAFLVFVLTAILHTEYLVWTLLVLELPGAREFMDIEATRRILPVSIAVTILSWVLSVLMAFLRKVGPGAIAHEYACNMYYGLSLCVFSHLSGTMTMATGVVLAGAPVLGFILFRPGPVLWALAAALLVQTLSAVGAFLGWWTYAPAIAIPLGTDGQLSGFWLASMTLFTTPHLIILTFLSWYVLSGWRRREEAVQLMSLTDSLTGLPNRRSILALLENEMTNSRLGGHPLSVVIVDLDHFKQVNDQHGHAVGDAALTVAARALRGALRQNDHVGRYGGEEFLMLLPGADDNGGRLLAERCREALSRSSVDGGQEEPLRVTASFGLCSNADRPDIGSEEMLRLADEALYRAKHGGRDRVELVAAT